jgi:hypothetical protein
MVLIGYPETEVRNYYSSLGIISQKSAVLIYFTVEA